MVNKLSKLPLFAVFSAALLVRIVFTLLQWHHKFLSAHFYTQDTYFYDVLAQNLAAGNGFLIDGQPSAFRTPLYPIFLAFFYSLVGRNFVLIGLIQCVIGACTCFFIYGTAKKLFDKRTAVASALFFALAPNMILSTSGYILTEPLFIFLTFASLYGLVSLLSTEESTIENKQILLSVAVGLLLALSSLTRPVFFYFSILAVIYLAIKASRRKALITFAVFALMMSIWGMHNYQTLGKFILTTTGGGYVLYEYHNPATASSNGGMNPEWAGDAPSSSQVPRFEEADKLPEIERDKFYLQKALSFALENPAKEMELSFNRFWNLWRPTFSTARGYNKFIIWITYVPMMLFALPMIFYFGLSDSKQGLLVLFLFYDFLFYLFLVAEIRFRFPLEPALIIYAAAGAVKLVNKSTTGE